MFDPQLPYNDLPLLPPTVDLETKAVMRKTVAANKALAALKCAGDLLPNQSVFLQALGLQEGKSSNELENIGVTNDELYRAFYAGDFGISPNAREILQYKDALWHGYQYVHEYNMPITTRLIEDLFRIVKGTEEGIRKGTRTKLVNWNGELVYTPPEGEEILRLKLANLVKFINEPGDLDHLIKLAVMHYQFEAIHPFPDGNGRVGRLLNTLFLVSQNLLDWPILYLSRYIIKNEEAYYAGLRQVTEHYQWEPWILYMLSAVEETSLTTQTKIQDICTLMHVTAEYVKDKLPGTYSANLIEIIHYSPYCKATLLEKAKIAKGKEAASCLEQLAGLGLLTPFEFRNETYYINYPLLDIFTR